MSFLTSKGGNRPSDYLTNYRAILVKYMGPTNFRGSRVKLVDFRNGKSVTISYNSMHNRALDSAIIHLEKLGINIVGGAWTKDTDILLTDTFDVALK